MISGKVTSSGVPIIRVAVGSRTWTAIIDTGFNGDLELPESLRAVVNPRFAHTTLSALAGGQEIVEDVFTVDFTFDDQSLRAEASFVQGEEILIGTRLLKKHRLLIDLVAAIVHLERAA